MSKMILLFSHKITDEQIVGLSFLLFTKSIGDDGFSLAKWRKGKYKITTIIDEEALELSHVIRGIKARFQGFVVRY